MENKKVGWLIGCMVCFGLIICGGLILAGRFNSRYAQKKMVEQWVELYLVTDKESAFINGSNDHEEVQALSEAQGYGLLIAVQAAKKGWVDQTVFDQLLTYYVAHQISADNALMDWKQVEEDGEMVSVSKAPVNATDGDMDIAYALFLADEQFGSQGVFNYKEMALNLTAALLTYTFQEDTHLLFVGDWAKEDETYQYLVRTSDLNLFYFAYFFEKTRDTRWQLVQQAAENTLLQLSDLNQTGLIPDFAFVTPTAVSVATANVFEGENDGDFGWNANRVPWRLALDDNVTAKKVSSKFLSFFRSQSAIYAGYQLSGTPLVDYSSMAFSAPLALASQHWLGAEDSLSKQLKQEVTSSPLVGSYYGDTIQVLIMLQQRK